MEAHVSSADEEFELLFKEIRRLLLPPSEFISAPSLKLRTEFWWEQILRVGIEYLSKDDLKKLLDRI